MMARATPNISVDRDCRDAAVLGPFRGFAAPAVHRLER